MPAILIVARRFAFSLAFFYAAGAHADCVDTVRLSAAERDFYLRANAALKSFLPPAPEGENIRSHDRITDPQGIQVCKGDKPGDFTVQVQRRYVWPDPRKHSADTVVVMDLSINTRSFGKSLDNDRSGAYGNPSPGRSAGLRVHNVEWRVSGDQAGMPVQQQSLRPSIAAAVDRDGLQALVGRPLPTVAASEAKSAPPTRLVAAPAPAPAAATPSAGSPAPATPAAAPQPASTGATAPSAPTSSDTTMRDAADTVQKLRGLFGR